LGSLVIGAPQYFLNDRSLVFSDSFIGISCQQMNRFITFFLACLLGIACKEGAPSVTPEIVLSTTGIAAEAEAGTYVFHVKCNTEWTAGVSPDWAVLSVRSGSAGTTRIEVAVQANTNSQSREALITVSAGTAGGQVRVIQKGAEMLNISKNQFDLPASGGEISFEAAASSAITLGKTLFWIEQKPVSGNSYYFTIGENPAHFPRTGTITLGSGNIQQVVTIHQEGKKLMVDADKTGMESNAAELAAKIKIGWNLGNSLEACADENTASETLWGNPATSKELIDLVKRSGFNAVRIPTAWSGYIEDRNTYKIKDEWMMRVREVVDYCVANGMYAIINIHWDGGWLENNPTYARQAEVNKKQKALWEQIAVAFRDYDEHLLFAGANEVHADYNRPTAEHLQVQMSYNQTFVDAVRSTGGRNAWRVLVAQGYNTNIQYTYESLVLPKDPAVNRMMAEVHYYDPYDFTLESGASAKYLWGKDFKGSTGVSAWGQEDWVNEAFGLMKEKFTSKGIPVILGEYAATYRASLPANVLEDHKKARNYYLNYVTKTAKSYGLIPFYWDNGGTGNNASGIFDRPNLTVVHADALEALLSAADF